jgi:hypothetical protein
MDGTLADVSPLSGQSGGCGLSVMDDPTEGDVGRTVHRVG